MNRHSTGHSDNDNLIFALQTRANFPMMYFQL